MRHRPPPIAMLVVGLLALAPSSSAQTGIDAQENVFGATNVHAVAGHGRLTVGVSRDGDLSVLSWPSPSYSDQLGYLTSNDFDARSQPRFGAAEGAGVFVGLRCDLGGSPLEVTWLRDRAAWTIEQDYGPDDGPHPHTRFRNETLGLSVVLIDAVAPHDDTWVRRVVVTRDPQSPVQQAWLLTVANLSPLPRESRVAELPIVDWAKDGANDFAAAWHEAEEAIVHFHPADQRIYRSLLQLAGDPSVEWGPVGDLLKQASISATELDTLVGELDGTYGEGAWLALGTVPAPDQHQVGFDTTPFCDGVDAMLDHIGEMSATFPEFESPLGPDLIEALRCPRRPAEILAAEGWVYPAVDGFTDARDGELAGAGLAAGEVSEALRTPLSFDAEGVASAAVVLGAGRTMSEALAARHAGDDPDAVIRDSADTLAAWLGGLTIPGSPGERAHAVARRALINLRVGTDASTGAVVASIARQPPYQLDWPRDGAFFNVLLDVSGQTELVEQRLDLYASWQRPEAIPPTPIIDVEPPVDPSTGDALTYPADAWEMNYYADGVVGGMFRFEIDSTAFSVWSIVAHAGWASDPEAHLRRHWDTITRGLELLVRWRDPATGLHAPAQEDDQATFSQTLHGAISVFGALDIGARAARRLGDDGQAERWEQRAVELRDAIEAHFYDPASQTFFMTESDRLPMMASGLTPTGPTAWMIWPCTMMDFDDPRVGRQLARDYGIIEPVLHLTPPGGLYFMKSTIPLALAGGDEWRDVIAELPATLAHHAAADTDYFGEVMVVLDRDGTPYPDQRVATPHLWEGALFTLTAMAAQDPHALRAYDEVLPPSRVIYPQPETESGCDCASAPGRPSAPGGPLPALLLVALTRRRTWPHRYGSLEP